MASILILSPYISMLKTAETDLTSLRHRIPTEKRQECLKLFEQGYGYKKTAQLAGLNAYTVREYKRKYAAGDNSWAYRGGMTV